MTIERSTAYYDKEYVTNERSPQDIADEWNTYPNKIRRELKKLGYPLRDKSKAQAVALKTGRHKHPTEGSHRTESTKIKISEGMADNWKSIDVTERERRSATGRSQWENMSDLEKSEFQRVSLEAVRETSREGSKMEKCLYNGLQKLGYEVLFHSEHILPNTRLQADLFIPSHKTVIEIDGPSHFLPIWGQESLDRNIKADQEKNSTLLTYGFVVIRVKHLAKTTSQIHERQVITKVNDILEKIKTDFPELQNRLIEIEVS